MLELLHQWATAEPLIKGNISWISGLDKLRIQSYQLYEEIYWNIPDSFKLLMRGAEGEPIYIPSAKTIVETLHRYMANDFSVMADPMSGTPEQQQSAMVAMTDFVRRERFYSKFSSNKRFGIIRGDWLWHIFADESRPEGSRISIFALDPGAYFPITRDENVDEIIGAHIVEKVSDDKGKEFIHRLTYRKATGTGGPSAIDVTDDIFEVDKWGGPGQDEKAVRSVRPPFQLDAQIDSLPIYHIQNFREDGTPWGSSELRGFERLLSAINQSITDEDLTLVLEGLGVYATDSGHPVDEESGEPLPWTIGPGKVVETADGKTFYRVNSSATVTPYQDHLTYLHDQLDLATGTPRTAQGRVDVSVAESGIALLLEMGPILSRASEKELIITDVMTNLLFDLRKWFGSYEPQLKINADSPIRWLPKYGDKLPLNQAKRFDQILQLAMSVPPVVSGQWVRSELAKLGFQMPADDSIMMKQILDEMAVIGKAQADAAGLQLDSELSQPAGTETVA